MLKNYALPQFNNNNNSLIPQLDGASVHFAQHFCDCLNMNFPGRSIEEENQLRGQLFLLILGLWTFSSGPI
jgi:hypothetical protein